MVGRANDESVAALLESWFSTHAPTDLPTDAWIAEQGDLAAELLAAVRTLRRLAGGGGSASVPEPASPGRLGEYRLLREIGRGGMGIVYEAAQDAMDRRVAVKVLYPSLGAVAHSAERFQREARAAGRLQHTSIVTVHQLGQDRGVWYCAMELVTGRSLDHVLADLRASRSERRRGRSGSAASVGGASSGWAATSGQGRSFHALAEAFAELAEALHFAHEHGVVHRDVKPANLMLATDGRLKILDFGLARLREESTTLTLTGGILGTPAYMSPEQARGQDIDAQSDVWSLGAVLYEVLTLRPPFAASSVADLLARLRTDDPRRPSRIDRRVPRDLETIVLKALEKPLASRYGSSGAMARDLRAFAQGHPIGARRVGVVGRALRRVRRHRTAATLLALLAVAGGAAVAFGVRASNVASALEGERERRTELEYLGLCVAAEDVLFGARSSAGPGAATAHDAGHVTKRAASADELYTRAIALVPGRPEAWLGRALCGSRSFQAQHDDLVAAESRGIGRRTAHLARAWVFRQARQPEDARAEEAAAAASPPGDVRTRLFEALLMTMRAETASALTILSDVLRDAPRGSGITYLARRMRARLRLVTGDAAGGLADCLALREQGDDGPETGIRTAVAWRRLEKAEEAERAFAETLDRAVRAGEADVGAAGRTCLEWRCGDWATRVVEAGLRAYPDSTRLRVVQGRVLVESNRHEEAVTAMEALGKAHAEEHEPDEIRAVALLALGRVDAAAAAARAAVERDPTCPAARRELGRSLGLQGNPAEALAQFERGLELDPGDVGLHGLVVEALRSAGRIDDALARLDAADARFPNHFELVYQRAGVLRRARRPAEALGLAERLVALDPRDVRGWALLGTLHLEAQRLAPAEEAFGRALAIDPGRVDVHGNLGILYRLKDDLPSAEKALRAAVEREPRDATWHVNLGEVLSLQRRPADALESFDLAVRYASFPQAKAMALDGRAEALLNLGRPAEALPAAEEAARLLPDYAWPRFHVGAALLDQGRPLEGLPHIEKAVAMERNEPLFRMHHRRALDRAGRTREAVAAAREEIRRGGGFPWDRNFLAWELARRPGAPPEEVAEAAAWMREAAAQAKKPTYWNTLGAILLRAGDLAEGIAALRRSLEAGDPTLEGSSCALLALGLARSGAVAQARPFLERARGWDATRRAAGNVDEDVASLIGEAEAACEGR